MFHKIKFIMPLAVALLAGALLASPALAQRTGGAISGSGNVSAAPSGGGGGHISAGPSLGAPAGSGYRGGPVNAARGSGPARVGGRTNYAYNGRHHHHHRDHDGHFGFGFFGGPYGYDYDDSWPNSWAYEPDCYLRRVHIHHHWVLRRYCD
jgi:hypothetical protein